MHKFSVLKEILETRHSWREYDPKKITENDINEILEAARHSPSSYGCEPWHILVISNDTVKEELFPFIGKQPQVLKASHLFILLSYKANVFKENSAELKHRYQTRYNNDSKVASWLQSNLLTYLDNIKDVDEWARRQTYILLENLILCCFAKEIGTSPMEGFDGDAVINYLEINNYVLQNKFNVAVIVAAGYLPKDKTLSFEAKNLTVEELVTKIN